MHSLKNTFRDNKYTIEQCFFTFTSFQFHSLQAYSVILKMKVENSFLLDDIRNIYFVIRKALNTKLSYGIYVTHI